jgi:hypothetical protein
MSGSVEIRCAISVSRYFFAVGVAEKGYPTRPGVSSRLACRRCENSGRWAFTRATKEAGFYAVWGLASMRVVTVREIMTLVWL